MAHSKQWIVSRNFPVDENSVGAEKRSAFRRIQTRKIRQPFHINAWVVLPDHRHCIWTLPPRRALFRKEKPRSAKQKTCGGSRCAFPSTRLIVGAVCRAWARYALPTLRSLVILDNFFDAEPGDFLRVRIVDADEHGLYAEAV